MSKNTRTDAADPIALLQRAVARIWPNDDEAVDARVSVALSGQEGMDPAIDTAYAQLRAEREELVKLRAERAAVVSGDFVVTQDVIDAFDKVLIGHKVKIGGSDYERTKRALLAAFNASGLPARVRELEAELKRSKMEGVDVTDSAEGRMFRQMMYTAEVNDKLRSQVEALTAQVANYEDVHEQLAQRIEALGSQMAALTEVTEALAKTIALFDEMSGCGDGSCRVKRPTGMHTNGGCRCGQNPIVVGRLFNVLTHARAILAATENAERGGR